ncbi:MAG: lytic transglycosylase domain-containing protein [Fimbriimonadaceae bacterium]
MSFNIRGFEGTQSRIQEIKARISQLEGRVQEKTAPKNNDFAATLGGKIGAKPGQSLQRLPGLGFQNTPLDSNAPFDPVAMGLINPGAITSAGSDLKTQAAQIAEKYGVDPALFQALIQQESAFNPNAISSAGAMGLTQLMPKTAKSLGVFNPMNPVENMEGGAKYLAQLMKQFNGDRKLALAAYNAGPGAVTRFGGIPPYKETQNYVNKILGNIGGN